ncbi:MAG: hypothetical protein ACHQ4F_00805 [Candidatus Dormibacteria bacterium]
MSCGVYPGAARLDARLAEAIERFNDPHQKILAVFAARTELFEQPDFNGCAFIAASTEAPADGLVDHAADAFRAWIRAMVTTLAEQAEAPRSDHLACIKCV